MDSAVRILTVITVFFRFGLYSSCFLSPHRPLSSKICLILAYRRRCWWWYRFWMSWDGLRCCGVCLHICRRSSCWLSTGWLFIVLGVSWRKVCFKCLWWVSRSCWLIWAMHRLANTDDWIGYFVSWYLCILIFCIIAFKVCCFYCFWLMLWIVALKSALFAKMWPIQPIDASLLQAH